MNRTVWDVSHKNVLITGGSTGIGEATAAALAADHANVVITSRTSGRGESVASDIATANLWPVNSYVLDYDCMDSVQALAEELIQDGRVPHVLIHNAGTMLAKRRETLDGFEATMAAHYFGPYLLTRLLLPYMRDQAPCRIINVSSRLHRLAKSIDFDDLQLKKNYSGNRAYTQSKLALMLFNLELSSRLANDEITVNALHPGSVVSDLRRDAGFGIRAVFALARPFLSSAADGAATTIQLASDFELEDVTGAYFSQGKRVDPSPAALDRDAAATLWDIAEDLLEPWLY